MSLFIVFYSISGAKFRCSRNVHPNNCFSLFSRVRRFIFGSVYYVKSFFIIRSFTHSPNQGLGKVSGSTRPPPSPPLSLSFSFSFTLLSHSLSFLYASPPFPPLPPLFTFPLSSFPFSGPTFPQNKTGGLGSTLSSPVESGRSIS